MNIMPERSLRYQPPPPPHRRKTPSFSSSLLDSILRSIDESNDDDTSHQQQLHHHDDDIIFFASQPKRSHQHRPSLRRAIMIDQWMDTQNNNNNRKSYTISQKFSSDSSSSGTETETPSTYRSLPNSFTISKESVFLEKASSTRREVKFMKSTKLRAMKIYGDLKKVKQPVSPGSRISAFIYSLFASSSSKKAKIQESMHNFRSLKKSRSINKQDTTMTCTSFSRSCMSKKQHSSSSSSVKRSVRFYPENDNKSVHDQRHSDSMAKYERRWFTEKNYVVDCIEDEDDEDEDDLFELEIVGGVGTAAYTQELPVFETTDLRKIRKI